MIVFDASLNYLDPVSGSFLLQALAALAIFLTTFAKKIKVLFLNFKNNIFKK